MDKPALVAAFRALLHSRLQALEAGSGAARDGTRVDGSHRPANRGERAAVTAQGYLAHGLAERAAALKADLALLDEVDASPAEVARAGARVRIRLPDDGLEEVLILPGGYGDALHGVTIISPAAPLARALRGKAPGDPVQLQRSGATVEAEVEDVD